MSEHTESTRLPGDENATWASPAPAWWRALKYGAEAQEMRKHPGKRVQFPDRPTPRIAYNLADNIRRGRLVAFAPAGAFGAEARRCTVQAWFIEKEDT